MLMAGRSNPSPTNWPVATRTRDFPPVTTSKASALALGIHLPGQACCGHSPHLQQPAQGRHVLFPVGQDKDDSATGSGFLGYVTGNEVIPVRVLGEFGEHLRVFLRRVEAGLKIALAPNHLGLEDIAIRLEV